MLAIGFSHHCNQHTVHQYEYGNRYHVWVCDKYGSAKRSYPWHGEGTTLKTRWWRLSSPAERIRNYRIKAQHYADTLNHKDMYIQHEMEIVKK